MNIGYITGQTVAATASSSDTEKHKMIKRANLLTGTPLNPERWGQK